MLLGWLTLSVLFQCSWTSVAAQGIDPASGKNAMAKPSENASAATQYKLQQQKIALLLGLLRDDCQDRLDVPGLLAFQNMNKTDASNKWYLTQIAKGVTLQQQLKGAYRECLSDESGELVTMRDAQNCAKAAGNGGDERYRANPQIMNLAHYYMPIYHDGQDNGYVQKLPYTKGRRYTDIRVQWYGNIRAHFNVEGCGRWRVLFNGHECSDPGPIEAVDYQYKRINEHRNIEIDGICKGIGRGPVTIGLTVGACSGFGISDSYTGWNSPRHIMVYEIDRREDTGSSWDGLSLFNLHYDASRTEDDSDAPGHVVRTLRFTKKKETTGIYIQYTSVAAITYHNNLVNYCGRWYATFDGEECADPAPIDMIFHPTTTGNGAFNHRTRPYKHYSMHGICRGSPRGIVTIQIRIGPCYNTPQAHLPDFINGRKDMTYFRVEEVKEKSHVKEVIGSGGHARIPMFNIYQYVWMNINSDLDQGIIRSVTYTKTTGNTGLRLTWMGSHRHYANGISCGRWFFTIDGAECSRPISGVSYHDHKVDYHHPHIVSGVCNGISAGNHTIQYNVGNCKNFPVRDSYTGWGSSSRMIIMELQVTTSRRCVNQHGC